MRSPGVDRGNLHSINHAFHGAAERRGRIRNERVAFERELWLCFFAGVVRQRWRDRKCSVAQGAATAPPLLHAITPTSAAGVEFTRQTQI